jgi:hypothetical protein
MYNKCVGKKFKTSDKSWFSENHNGLSIQGRTGGETSLPIKAQDLNVECPFARDFLSNKRKKRERMLIRLHM